ncbi:hypothetical protein DIPPA_12220 [Diplonema papillatum]|nr:hypothetical protein DIPPA_12220 [Diplonema papillatum]
MPSAFLPNVNRAHVYLVTSSRGQDHSGARKIGISGQVCRLPQRCPKEALMTSSRSSRRQDGRSAGRMQPLERKQRVTITAFRRHYDRGDLPAGVLHLGTRNAIDWKIAPARLEYHFFLPLFFDGLREVAEPYRTLAVQGCIDLVLGAPSKSLACLPKLIPAIRSALDTLDPAVVHTTLGVLQVYALSSPHVGPALVPHLPHILPPFSALRTWQNAVEPVGFGTVSRQAVGDAAMETLEILEKRGGAAAFKAIKRTLPTYESCIQ